MSNFHDVRRSRYTRRSATFERSRSRWDIKSTVRYLGVDIDDALTLSERTEI